MKNVIKIGFAFCLFLVNACFASNTETEMDETMPLLKASINYSVGFVRNNNSFQHPLAQPGRGPHTAQREVLENRDLVRLIGSHLSLNEFRRLALINRSMCTAVRKVYPLDQFKVIELMDSLDGESFLIEKHGPTSADHLRKIHAFFYFADGVSKNPFNINLRQEFINRVQSLLYVANVRHPYSGIKKDIRDALDHIVENMDLVVPKPSFSQSLWALYAGYRYNDRLNRAVYVTSLLALLGGGAYTIAQSTMYGDGTFLSSYCMNTIITNASIDYSSLNDNQMATTFDATVAPLLETTTVVAGIGSAALYPLRRVLSLTSAAFDREPGLSTLPNLTAPKTIRDLDDFLDLCCSEPKTHYAPTSQGVVTQARKLKNYLINSGHMSNDVEFGVTNLEPALKAKIQQLTNIMAVYKWSPTYRLLGGEGLRQALISIPGVMDKEIGLYHKLTMPLYADPLRYVISAAFYYGCYQIMISPMFSELKDGVIARNTGQIIQYAEYATKYAGSKLCCLVDAEVSNNLCPTLGEQYALNSYLVANVTKYVQSSWETKLFTAPFVLFMINIFYFIMG